MTDYYSEFRPELLNATDRSGTRGSFDPLVKVAMLAPELARELDTRGGELPATSVEAGGSAPVAAYATSLHETIHWWQMVGSTTGLLSGLTSSAQSNSCAPHLANVVGTVSKPMLNELKSRPELAEASGDAWKACSRWFDLEIANCLLLEPLHAFYRLQSDDFLFESVGYALAQHAATTTGLIARVLSAPLVAGRDEWERLLREARETDAPGFTPGSLVKFPLGARHLFEGQARLIELQYRTRAVAHQPLPELEEQGWLDGVYGEALNVFLESTECSLPDDVEDPFINLFLLLCDIAINPSRGYPAPIGSPNTWVAATHPGVRFESLCGAAKKRLGALLELLRTVSLKTYGACTELLLGDADWLPPDAVARETSQLLSGTDLWAGLPDSQDAAAHLILAAHQSFVEMKAEIPHFFCWPAPFLTGEPDDDLSAYEALLELYSPPFHANPDGGGVDTAHLPEIAPKRLQGVTNRYFRTVAVYELVRQWISERGPFRFDYTWKPELRPDELQQLTATFEKSLGVRLNDIHVEAHD